MRLRPVVALALVAGSLAVAVPLAAAGGSGGSSAKVGDYEDAIAKGSLKYVAKDFEGAVELFRKATQNQPRNPLGLYLLGEAQLAAGSLADADASWLQAAQVADAGTPALKAKILFVTADLRERQGKWDDAKVAWKDYADFVAKTPESKGFPDSAAARIRDIEANQRLYATYATVRKRIRDEDGGVLGKMPPPEKP